MLNLYVLRSTLLDKDIMTFPDHDDGAAVQTGYLYCRQVQSDSFELRCIASCLVDDDGVMFAEPSQRHVYSYVGVDVRFTEDSEDA